MLSDNKYLGGVFGPDGKIVFLPFNADNIGILELGNHCQIRISPIKFLALSGNTPEAWTSHHHFSALPALQQVLILLPERVAVAETGDQAFNGDLLHLMVCNLKRS
jgi:hypothetical protein